MKHAKDFVNKSLIIGLIVGGLIAWLVPFLFPARTSTLSVESETDFIVEEQPGLAAVLAELTKLFSGQSITGIVLVDDEGRLRGFRSDGSAVDFCSSLESEHLATVGVDAFAAANQCKRKVSVRFLAQKVNNCGTCRTYEGDSVSCNKRNGNYSREHPDMCPARKDASVPCENNCS